jgi:hypothetical protein
MTSNRKIKMLRIEESLSCLEVTSLEVIFQVEIFQEVTSLEETSNEKAYKTLIT